MRILNKQSLEKDIREVFKTLMDKGPQALSEDAFSQALTDVLAKHENLLEDSTFRMGSVLFADLRGFTYLNEHFRSDKIISILNEFFGTMAAIINQHGGIIDKFMGDSVIAFFDVGDSVSESVRSVLQCAIEMQIAMNDVNRKGMELGLDTIFMGIGINTGEVVASVLGSEIYREFTMIGTHVNLAARIEQYTLRGQILISERTYNYVKGSVVTGKINEVNAKGLKKTLRFYDLKALTEPVYLELPQRENRSALRIPVRIPVSFQLLDGKNVLPEIFNGEVVDISYGGMLIDAPAPIKQFSDIKIKLNLSPLSSEPVDLYAKAMYVHHKNRGAEVGLEFTIIDDATSAKLKNFVDNLI